MLYADLVKVYDRLESTAKRLEKTSILSEFFKTVSEEECEHIILLLQGCIFPKWDSRETGIAQKLLVKSLEIATGKNEHELKKIWKECGDLGLAAEKLTQIKIQATLFSQSLTTQKVFENLQKIPVLKGQGSVDRKLQYTAELLTSAKPLEVKYLVRTIIGDLRIGLGEGTIRDAIVWSCFEKEIKLEYNNEKNELQFPNKDRTKYEKYAELVQEALDISNDFSIVLRKSRNRELDSLQLVVGRPINVMLFQKAKNIQEALATVGKPAAIEKKYDGFRVQIHKQKNNIVLFTRRLENVSSQFPDIISAVIDNVKAENCILDAEIVGYDKTTKRSLPFQNISQRIKRKYDINETAEQYPVKIHVFDCLFIDKKTLLKETFQKRRELLKDSIKEKENVITLAEQIITSDENKISEFYEKSLDEGHEGIMLKNLSGIYKPGSRVGYGVKVKPTMETLEVVIIGAEWGEGKRGAWLSSFIIAVQKEDDFVEIGRVGTGFKEKSEEGISFDQITELLKPLIIKENGKEVIVRPEIIIEVDYEEIQTSPTYNSGYALRFPRFVRLREDRGIKDINSIDDVEKYYAEQRGRSVIKST